MSYGRNFGMRSFENIVRDGRFRVPATGSAFKIGAPVMLDSATPGRLKAATQAVTPGPNCGVVVYEYIQNKSDALTTSSDSPYDSVPLGEYAQMVHGAGAKIWLRNTASKTLYDGRVRSSFSFVTTDLTTITPGMGLVPAGSGVWRATDASGSGTTGGVAWLVVEQVNTTTGLVEARFTF